jgi:2'-5' RNA ligase
MSGYSLWLSPPSSSFLNSLLVRLAKENDTEAFQPHATLVSDEIVPEGLSVEQMVDKVKEGTAAWRKEHADKLKLAFEDVRKGVFSSSPSSTALLTTLRAGNAYYQCVLAAVHPSPALLALHHSIVSSFSLPSPPQTPYFPHLSLVYGDLSSIQKDSIIAALEADGTVTRQGEGVAIGGEDGFEPSEILLVRTKGKCETWEVVERIPL